MVIVSFIICVNVCAEIKQFCDCSLLTLPSFEIFGEISMMSRLHFSTRLNISLIQTNNRFNRRTSHFAKIAIQCIQKTPFQRSLVFFREINLIAEKEITGAQKRNLFQLKVLIKNINFLGFQPSSSFYGYKRR